MGSENPLEILENECVNNETKDKVDKKSPDLKDFISDDGTPLLTYNIRNIYQY